MNHSIVSAVVFGWLLSVSVSSAESEGRLHRLTPQNPTDLRALFHYDGVGLPLVSAHRGGAVGAFPENCLATFEHTLESSFSLLEIDLQTTSDGVIVLHHDPTLERTTTGTGLLKEQTWQQLQPLRLKDKQGNSTPYQIPKLDSAIEWARDKTILILDKKDVPLEVCVEKIRQHKAQSFVMIMAYSFDDIETCHRLDPDIMMEVMIGNEARFEGFEKTGVPWNRIVAFVGHQPPSNRALLDKLHAENVSCMAGTSRNLDRELRSLPSSSRAKLRLDYQAVLNFGIDVLETDLPVELTSLLKSSRTIPDRKAMYFHLPDQS